MPHAIDGFEIPCTELPDGLGCFAHIIDTEGNRVGLHAEA